MSHFADVAKLNPLELANHRPEKMYLCTNCLTVCCESECVEYSEPDADYTELRCHECDSEKLKDLNGDAVDWLVEQIKNGVRQTAVPPSARYEHALKCLGALADIANGQHE